MTERAICQVIDLGRLAYQDAWALQEQMATRRGADQIPDTLLLVEHPHTYTLGTSGQDANVLLSPEDMHARGIEIYRVNRGGDVTYHGPGQLVGYPIIKLPAGGDGLHADVVSYVRQIEQTLIRALAGYGIAGWPYPGLTGVWVGDSELPAKLAAIGVKVTVRRVTMHGFALNVNTDLDYFKGIIPCGISDKPVTSMQIQLGRALDFHAVADQVVQAFGDTFERTMTNRPQR
ncbi:MAG: lipoyl(octanoyl) transferase LipB [Anaerolineae bacterium]|nr:lipoyl(octanoyl) transferase LipB [Anaerolineae bacterium]